MALEYSSPGIPPLRQVGHVLAIADLNDHCKSCYLPRPSARSPVRRATHPGWPPAAPQAVRRRFPTAAEAPVTGVGCPSRRTRSRSCPLQIRCLTRRRGWLSLIGATKTSAAMQVRSLRHVLSVHAAWTRCRVTGRACVEHNCLVITLLALCSCRRRHQQARRQRGRGG